MAESSTSNRIVWAGLAVLGAFALLTLGNGPEEATLLETRVTQAVAPVASSAETLPAPVTRPPRELALRSGQTLSEAMSDLGLDNPDAHAAVTALSRFVDPRRLRPGDVYRARFDADRRDRDDRGRIGRSR